MTRMKTMAVLMAGAILALAGCGNDSEGPKQTVDQILSEAWADFAAGDYTTAADRFGDAVSTRRQIGNRLRQHPLHDLAMNVGQPEFTALVAVR